MNRRIEGVVAKVAAASSGGTAWDLVLLLCPWREVGGVASRKELRLLVPMKDKAAASRAMAEWRNRAVALSLTRLDAPSNELPMGLAVGCAPLERIEPDLEFLEIVREREKPRGVEDAVLGKLVLDRRVNWYTADRVPGQRMYGVAVQTPDPDDDVAVADAISRAGRVVLGIDGRLPALLDAIVDKMLDLYNSTWREEEPVLSGAEFRERLALGSVTIADGWATAYFDCDGLFTDHVIEVRLGPSGSVTEIGLAG